MKFKQLAGYICGILISVSLHADTEPLNVFVDDLTFTRPTTWRWEPPNPMSPAVTRFIIPGYDARHSGDVRFYETGQPPEGTANSWKRYLNKEDENSLRRESKTIGRRTVDYIFFQGTLKLPGEKAEPDQGLVGVIIPCENKFLHIRFSGPKKLVEQAIPDLKTMVENAVREREEETK